VPSVPLAARWGLLVLPAWRVRQPGGLPRA
jgi:hypothetical protein